MNKDRLLLIFLGLLVIGLTLSVVSATNNDTTSKTLTKIEKTTDNNNINTNQLNKENNINKKQNKSLKSVGNYYVSTTGKSTNIGTENSPLDIGTAVEKAKNANGGNIILYAGTYKLSSQLEFNKAGTYSITGKAGQKITLDGQKKTRMLLFKNGVTAEVKNIIFTNGHASNWGNAGGAIYAETGSKVTINNNTFTQNNAKNGGAIIIKTGNAAISNNIFTKNTAEEYGGACYLTGNMATLTGNIFTSNTANIKGGACYVQGNEATFNTNKFTSNVATKNGGGIYTYGSNNLKLIGNTFTSNRATLSSGAVYTNSNSTMIQNNIFNKNTAQDGGGLVTTNNKLVSITNNIFQDNTATKGPGGALEVLHSISTSVSDNFFTGNKAPRDGGAVTIIGGSSHVFKFNNFTKNYSEIAAGSLFSDSTRLTISNNNFIENTAGRSSAGIYDEGTYNTISDNYFERNSVNGPEGDGGAVFLRSRYSTLSNNVFTNNFAKRMAGASYFDGSNSIAKNNKYLNNKANSNGGAIYLFSTRNMNITSNDFQGNTANNKGGAIMTSHTNQTIISKNTFNKNVAGTSGGAILNLDYKVVKTTYNTFTYNKAGRDGGTIMDQEGSSSTISYNTIYQNNATSSGGGVYTDGKNGIISYNNFTQNIAKNNGAGITNRGTNNNINNNRFVQNKASTTGSAIINRGNKATVSNNINDKTSKYSGTIYTDASGAKITYNIFDDSTPKPVVTKTATKVSVDPVTGTVGEKITLTAHVKTIHNGLVTGGNIAFKLNGKTLRTDGKFNSNAPAQKVSVKNGVATISIIADKYIRDAKTVSASYSGTSTYTENSTKTTTNAQIKLRNAKITVTTSPRMQSQYNIIRFTAKVSDVTGGKTSNLKDNSDDYVFWKVNGRTLTFSNGAQVKSRLKDGVATYDYVVPRGMAGISVSKQVRNYSVTAGFASSNYYPGSKTNTYFNVYRSNVTIKLSKITANMNSHQLAVKGTIVDYKSNKVIGTNKINLKINGKSLLNNNKAVYVSAKDGVIDFVVDFPASIANVKSVTLVTGERCAYTEGRVTTTSISRV